MQNPDAILVGGVGDPLPVIGDVEAFDVPRLATERFPGTIRQMPADELTKLRAFVAGEIDVAPVGRESRPRIGNGDPFRSDHLFCPGFQVEEIQLALVDRNRVVHQELVVVGREVARRPAATLDWQHHAGRLWLRWIDNIKIRVLAVPPRRGIRQPLPILGESRTGVARLAVGEQGDFARAQVEAIELKEFAAADVLGKQDGVRIMGPELGAADSIGKERQLPPRAARHLHQMQLRRAAEARDDQHLRTRRIPAFEGGGADFQIGPYFLHDVFGKNRNALDYQV